MNSNPPQPPPQAPKSSWRRPTALVICLAFIPSLILGTLVGLRIFGLLRPFNVPTGSMAPAVSAGDHVVMEGITYLARKPHRADIVVFGTDGIESMPQGQFYVKRVTGEPGEHVQLSQGKLFINDKPVTLSNSVGEITYPMLPYWDKTDVVVSAGCYYVVGDNTTNSLDSRNYGSIPRRNISGRIVFCYWPPKRIGMVK